MMCVFLSPCSWTRMHPSWILLQLFEWGELINPVGCLGNLVVFDG